MLGAAEQRYDFDSAPRLEKMPNGSYRIACFPTRVGVFPYTLPDGSIRRELRPPEEVNKEDSLRTLRGVALTDLHPPVPVTPDNWSTYARGHIGDDVRPDGNMIAATAIASHADLIRKIDSGDGHDLSCGYMTQLENSSGIWEGQPYDVIQRNIVYNHVGVGPKGWGRAGTDVALRVDGAYCTLPEMATQRIDGIDYEIGSKAHTEKVDQLITAHTALSTDLTTARKDAADAKAKADALTASVPKLVQERAWLIATGQRKDKTFCTDKKDAGISQEDLLAKVIKLVLPKFNPVGKSPEAIMAVLEAYAFPDAEGEEEKQKDPPVADPAAPVPVLAGGASPAADSLSAVRAAGTPPATGPAPMTLADIIEADRIRRIDQASVRAAR